MGIFAVPKILLFLVGESQCFRVFDIQTFGKISCNQIIVVGMGYPFFQNGLFKRVKVTNHNIDRFYSQFCHLFPMLFVVTDRQNTTFYIGMQGLHSAVKTFGELSQI